MREYPSVEESSRRRDRKCKIIEYLDIPLSTRAGGVGTYIRSVSKELKSRGHQVYLKDGIDRLAIPLTNRNFVGLSNEYYDIHHLHEPSTLLLLNRILQRPSKIKGNLVATVHAPIRSKIFGTVYSLLMKKMYENVKLVLTSTSRNAQYVLRHGIENIRIIPLWADSFFSPKQNMFKREKYVLNVCVVDEYHTYKNYPMLSRLGKFLRNAYNIELIHVGIHDFKLPYVNHIGVVSRAKLRMYYQNAILSILPSKGSYEGFGIVATEALACGTPVLVSDDCGISEYLTDEFVTTLGDFERKLAYMIEELINNPRELVQKAFDESKKFDYQNCVKVVDEMMNLAT